MSQSQFSEIIDISENGLGKIEREINTPNMETLYKISERIGISVEILLSPKKNPPQGKSKAQTDFLTYLGTLSSDEIKMIHEIALKIFEKKYVKKSKTGKQELKK